MARRLHGQCEGGSERTRSFEEVGRDLLRGEREKNVFLVSREELLPPSRCVSHLTKTK